MFEERFIGHILSFKYRKEQKMFSTPQSKAFFSQELVKGKLITEELQLVNAIYDRIWQSKSGIAEIIKLLWQPEQKIETVQQKLQKVMDIIQYAMQIVAESNEQFMFEVSLRSDIKHLEHAFFKNMMIEYQQKIKELKHCLLVLQNDVQSLEQKGLLPYVQNPQKNNILATKMKYFQQHRQKLKIMNQMLQLSNAKKLSRLAVGIVDSILHGKEDFRFNAHVDDKQNKKPLQTPPNLEKPHQIKEGSVESGTADKKIDLTKQSPNKKKQQYSGITQMLNFLQSWTTINNSKLKKYTRQYKQKIDALSNCNKTLKEGIRNYKKIMGYEQNQAMVRSRQIDLTRQQAIDFIRQMNEDLQCRFSRRNIYMLISLQPNMDETKSCAEFLAPQEQKAEEAHRQLNLNLNSNLNNSFLDQCSYLISDRFVPEQDQNEEMIV